MGLTSFLPISSIHPMRESLPNKDNTMLTLRRLKTRQWRHSLRLSTAAGLPIEPKSFQKGLVIDKHGEKTNTGFVIDRSGDGPLVLAEKNAHELDSRISYNEDTHEYYFDGTLLDESCTSLVGKYFQKFDADAIISKMVNGKNWPRDPYKFPNGDPYRPEDIKRQWESTKQYAANYGTWMHYNIERYFNGLAPSEKLPEMAQFFSFEKIWIKDQNIVPFRTEWKIAAPDWGIGGTVDFVGKREDDTFVIIDWKRVSNLEENLINRFNFKASPPINHLDDCDGSKYFLQLNLYKQILEKNYGIRVSSMVLASFHSKMQHYMAVEVPDMEFEILKITEKD